MTSPRFLRTALIAALLGLTLSACDSADTNPGVAPTLISSSAFSLDTGSFPSASGTANAQGGGHHFQAAARVFLINVAVGVHLIIPAAATDAATDVTPFVESGVWIWQNTVDVNGEDITFRLEGDPDGSEVDWRMLISADNIGGVAYDNFTLYTATTAIGGQTGTWSLFYRINGQSTRVLDADYEQTSSTLRELTFSVPESNPNQEARGASVLYRADGDTRTVDLDEATPGRTQLVEWDAVTRAGFLEAWNYNEGARACWDENLNDVACVSS